MHRVGRCGHITPVSSYCTRKRAQPPAGAGPATWHACTRARTSERRAKGGDQLGREGPLKRGDDVGCGSGEKGQHAGLVRSGRPW